MTGVSDGVSRRRAKYKAYRDRRGAAGVSQRALTSMYPCGRNPTRPVKLCVHFAHQSSGMFTFLLDMVTDLVVE